jgi:hypothetical protein
LTTLSRIAVRHVVEESNEVLVNKWSKQRIIRNKKFHYSKQCWVSHWTLESEVDDCISDRVSSLITCLLLYQSLGSRETRSWRQSSVSWWWSLSLLKIRPSSLMTILSILSCIASNTDLEVESSFLPCSRSHSLEDERSVFCGVCWVNKGRRLMESIPSDSLSSVKIRCRSDQWVSDAKWVKKSLTKSLDNLFEGRSRHTSFDKKEGPSSASKEHSWKKQNRWRRDLKQMQNIQ